MQPLKIAGIKHAGKRTSFTLDAKVNILKEVDANPKENRMNMASRLGIPKSTLLTILKNREKILEASARSKGKKRKRDRRSKFHAVEKALVQYIIQARSMQVKIPLSGSVLKEQARIIAARLKIKDFTGSNAWFDRFKERNNIVFKKTSGESASVPEETVTTWTNHTLPGILKGYAPQDVYNFDEFGYFYNLLPDKSMMVKNSDSHGNKQSKARVTVLIGSNADGSDKPAPLVIGKSKRPRCFENVRTLPCKYSNQKNAWMTSEEFTKFVRQFDTRMRIAKRKVLLFLDNCPAHPADIPGLTNVKMVFFPKNCTSRLQPMDQGVVKNVKHYSRVRFGRRLLDMIGRPDIDKKDFFINLLQAMEFLMVSKFMIFLFV